MLSLSLSKSFFFVCVCFSSFLFFLDFFSFIIAFFFLSLLLKCLKSVVVVVFHVPVRT